MAKAGVTAIVVITALLAISVGCEYKENLPEGMLVLPPNTRAISPMTDSKGNLQPSFESVVAMYNDRKVSKITNKKGLYYFIDCRKQAEP